MDKEQLIRELKYTKEKHKNDRINTFDTDISAMCSDVLDVLSRCVEIPDNASNGDVIKAMTNFIGVQDEEDTIKISTNWWNAPYK